MFVTVLLWAEWNCVLVVELVPWHLIRYHWAIHRLCCVEIYIYVTEVPTLCDERDGVLLNEIEKLCVWVQSLETKLCKDMQMVVELDRGLDWIWLREALLDADSTFIFFWAFKHVNVVSWVETDKWEWYWVTLCRSSLLLSCFEVSLDKLLVCDICLNELYQLLLSRLDQILVLWALLS